MRRLLLTAILSAGMIGAAQAETIDVGVNGLVCSFCATGIEKSFKKQDAVEQVKVDLDSKKVTIGVKPGRMLDDETVKQVLTDAGYSVTEITRRD